MLTLNCLVIREEPKGESSKLIYVLTAEKGILSVFVRGGMKSRKNAAATQLYVYSKLCLDEKTDHKGGTKYFLNSSEPIKIFYELRLNVYSSSLAAYLTDLLYYSRIEQADDMNEVLRLTLNTLYCLNEGEKDRELIKSIFEFRLLCDTGLRPNLIGCAHCFKYEADKMYFSLSSGNLECDECCDGKDSLYGFEFDRNMLYIVRHIALTDFDRLFSIRISPKYQKQLTEFTERFVRYHFSAEFKTLRFYRSL